MANENQFKLFTKFIATRGVEEYRQTIPIWIRPEDIILEIGCEWGTTSTLIWQKCKNLIATDISLDCIKVARTKYPGIRFETLDAFNIQQAMKLGTKFTKIYIDMSGLSSYRALLDVISLMNMYASVFEPEAIIIKSGSLKQFAKSCVAWKTTFPS
ncbi:MAG: class I SAM-dependent methyltransferase [bacterium]|nr:class I SAM-dependent methyltransferase [bacterium]